MDPDKLNALGHLVDEVDGEAPPSPEEYEAQQREAAAADSAAQAAASLETGARQWGSIAYMIGGALAMVAPELRHVYTERACLDWGRAVVPVADKYGWNGPNRLPELGLLIATMGLAVPSVLAIRAAASAEKPGGWLAPVKRWWVAQQLKRQASKAKANHGTEGATDGR